MEFRGNKKEKLTTASAIAAHIQQELPHVKSGMLRFQKTNTMNTTLFSSIIITTGISLISLHTRAGEPSTISVEDIRSGKIVITGLLGKPLGTIVHVKCRGFGPAPGEEQSKDPLWTQQVEVLQVDDVKLDKPVRIYWDSISWAAQKIPRAGETIRVIGYEVGGFKGIPHRAADYIESWQDSPMEPGVYFHLSFIALKKLD
jgi:hypothetical protein